MLARTILLRNNIKFINLRISTSASTYRKLCTSPLRSKWWQVGSAQRNLQDKDQLPENYELIYRAPMDQQLSWTKNISTATVTLITLLAGYEFGKSMNIIPLSHALSLEALVSHDSDIYYFLAGFALINTAIRLFVAKYPLRIYKSEDKYVAIYSSQLPMGIVKHYFDKGEIGVYKNFLNPWSHIMYKLGSRSSMLLIDYFKTPSEFHKLFNKK